MTPTRPKRRYKPVNWNLVALRPGVWYLQDDEGHMIATPTSDVARLKLIQAAPKMLQALELHVPHLLLVKDLLKELQAGE